MIIPRIAFCVKPNVFNTPTSLILSRTDMAIVFPETRRIVNVTAALILSRKNLISPRNETKLNVNCCSDSVFVGGDAFANIWSTVFAILGTSSVLSAKTAIVESRLRRADAEAYRADIQC